MAASDLSPQRLQTRLDSLKKDRAAVKKRLNKMKRSDLLSAAFGELKRRNVQLKDLITGLEQNLAATPLLPPLAA